MSLRQRLGVIRSESPLIGLRRRQLGFPEVLAQSIAAVAPSAAAVTIPGIVIGLAGGDAVWAFLAAAAIVILVGYSVTQFARRMASASGLYSYTAKALGVPAAFTTGWSLMIGYAGAAMASVLGAAVYLGSLAGMLGLNHPHSQVALAVGVVVVATGAALLMVRGIQVSARVSLALEVVSVAIVLTILLVLGLSAPDSSGGGSPAVHPGFDNATLGVLLAVTSFVGFESAGTLGAEARNPFTAVPRALLWTPVALTVLYLVSVGVQTSLFEGQPASLLSGGSPVADLAKLQDRYVLSFLLDLGIFSSWFACLVGSTSALVRVLFSMGREGVCPAWFGRTHSRFGTPVTAIVASVPVIAVVSLVVVHLRTSLIDVFVDLLTLSAYGYLVSYGLVCLAAPIFLRRLGELTPLPVVVGATATASIVFLVGWTITSFGFAHGGFALVYVVLMVLGWTRLGYLRWRTPGVLAEVGVYDEPIASDMLPVIGLPTKQ
ncbi:MAG: APC family permease [Actinomycetota bacterium]|nr:APC family permease [Actinomycetota bacterium]